ncbi:hypothetical protein GQ42DRAFT_155243 [Ramicandelaber brevisporus]|nr:hypothetical protein GQ42DRAFT_155243 [Ramicandelaber brevisporus]
MAQYKAFELRKKSPEELKQQLELIKKELAEKRVQKATSRDAKGLQIAETRKNLARVLTVISQNQHHATRLQYRGKKYKPLDVRAKTTRALRRKLTSFEASRKTVKQQKKDAHFPQRKFAVKA